MVTASIRPAKQSDDRLVRFMVAKANMIPLATANRWAYMHPLVLAIWIGLSSVFVQFMHWWPDLRYGYIAYLRPIPAFASVFMPIIYIIDLLNRPSFEKLAQDVVHAPDIKDFMNYYSRSPASGFWILEYDEHFVGLIAIDASVQEDASNKKSKITTSPTATIRHFYVQDPYPASGVQSDLLTYAVNHCFDSKQGVVQQIQATDSPLVPYTRKALKEAGFVFEKHRDTVGLFKWKLGVCTLQRRVWEKKKA
ncbi:hypothetical protein GGX14DRAFT_420637 [Mycena pura]|uniref:N-acetyltransferase domain-containing protein n=1 Tax=Mycena pura TaxID=153505 RepID=A0AAD7E2T8_9AGAR|nr:hypothetical protein GGX14DRAFT_420637 [Mycena pura]